MEMTATDDLLDMERAGWEALSRAKRGRQVPQRHRPPGEPATRRTAATPGLGARGAERYQERGDAVKRRTSGRGGASQLLDSAHVPLRSRSMKRARGATRRTSNGSTTVMCVDRRGRATGWHPGGAVAGSHRRRGRCAGHGPARRREPVPPVPETGGGA